MKRISIICTAALSLAAVSCMVEHIETPSAKKTITFSATLDSPDTKTSLVDGKKVYWTAGDAVSFFDKTGTTNTKVVAENVSNTTADFNYSPVTDGETEFIAVYPYKMTTAYDKTNLVTYIPNSQTAVKDSFDENLNLAIAIGNSTDKTLYFQNMCTLLKITIPDSEDFKNLSSVVVSSRESMTGKLTFTFEEGTGLPVLNKEETISDGNGWKEVVLVPGESNTIAPGTYYMVVRPNVITYSTFNIGFNFTDGSSALVTSTDQITTSANGIVNFGTASIEKAKTFKVTNAPGKVLPLNQGSYTLETNISDSKLSGKVVRFLSRNTSIATVDSESGVVTFKGVPGTAVITARLGTLKEDGSFSEEYNVPVVFNLAAGYYRDDLSKWTPATSSVNGDGYISVNMATQGTGDNLLKARADISRTEDVYLSREYPILCFKIDNLTKTIFTEAGNITLTAEKGTLYNSNDATEYFTGGIGGNNNKWVYEGVFADEAGPLYLLVYDLSTQKVSEKDNGLGQYFPANEIVKYPTFKIKYADMKPWTDGESSASYRFYGFSTFKTKEEAAAYYGITLTNR